MGSLLNSARPPVFCPGCAHERILHALDDAFQSMGLAQTQVAIVSDIGCSGLFDTFCDTHALHGLHGRALTYGAGIKLASPDLQVVVTMGDGGMGIGGAHVLAACRRNLDLTLLVLNNYNFGMTGGQYSPTTPEDAAVGSGFLNRLERPLDVARVVSAAGAPFVARCSAYHKGLRELLESAVRFTGFSVVDIHGICPGRYLKRNRLTPRQIEDSLRDLPPFKGAIAANARHEYGRAYRQEAAAQPPPKPLSPVPARFQPPKSDRQEILILGAAGQRIQTAGELLCLAGMSAGLRTSQKNEYNITVLVGPSVSEIILSPDPIDYTGISTPSVIMALAEEGVTRRKRIFQGLPADALVLRAAGISIPPGRSEVITLDFKGCGIRKPDWALASLGWLASRGRVLSMDMLQAALDHRFEGKAREGAGNILDLASMSL